MKKRILYIILLTLYTCSLYAQNKPELGTVTSYTILAGTGLVNVDNTEILGKAGVYPGILFNGLTPDMVKGSLEISTLHAAKAQLDLALAYNQLKSEPTQANLTAEPLSGKTLKPGVYKFGGDALLDGELTLDNDGNPEAVFIFQVNGNLRLEAEAKIIFSESAKPRVRNVFWQVTGDVSLGEGSTFRGAILASNNITTHASTQVHGRLLTTGGQVHLNSTHVSFPTDLALSMTKSPGSTRDDIYYIDETITFRFKAQNLGPVGAYNAWVRSPLPTGITFVSARASNAVYNPAAAAWTIAELPSGGSETLEITGKINNLATEFLTSSASIAGFGMEEILSNNGSTIGGICVAPANPGTIQGPTILCGKSGDNVFSVNPIPGVMSYNWLVPSGWSIVSGQNSPAITVRAGTTSGIITLTVGNVCASNTSQKNVTISAPKPLLPGVITAAPAKPCTGQAGITFTIPPVTGATSYAWQLPEDWVITAGNETNAITVTAGQLNGEVTVSALNACGVSPLQTLPVTLTASVLPAPGKILTPASLCAGTTAEYQVNEIPGATTYHWQVPVGWQILTGAGTSRISVAVGTAAGEVRVADSNNCTTGQAARIPVTPATLLAIGPVTGEAAPCAGESQTYTVAPVTGATAYSWTLPGDWQITQGQGTPAITVVAGKMTGEISVTANNSCGPGSAARIQVLPAALPGSPGAITASSPLPCAGEKDIRYTIAPVTGATSYLWTVPAGWDITAGQGTTTLSVTATAQGGDIVVIARNACGESAGNSLAADPATQAPATPLLISGSSNPCAGQNQLTYAIAPVNQALSYAWEVPQGWIITTGQGTTSIQVTVGTNPGNISVKGINNCGAGQEKLLAVVVSLQQAAAPAIITGNTESCAGEKIAYSTPEVTGAQAYAWEVPAGWMILSGQGSPAIQVTVGKTGGQVSVRTVNGCGSRSARDMTVLVRPGKPDMPAIISGVKSSCAGTTGLAYKIAPVAGATSYTWAVPGDWVITDGQGTNAITVTAGKVAGMVSVQAANTCGSSAAVSLEVAPALPVPASLGPVTASTNVYCQNQQGLVFQVAALPGVVSYSWQLPAGWLITAGAGSPAITVTAGQTAGKISVKASNTCGDSQVSELNLQPLPLTPLPVCTLTGPTLVCAEQSGLVYAVVPVPGATTYNWTVPAGWSVTSGMGTTQITVKAGTMPGSITVIAANNCAQSPAANLPIEKVLSAAPQAIKDISSMCQGLVYTIDKSAALTPGSSDKKPIYTWNIPKGWTVINGQGSGQLSVAAPAGSEKGTITVVSDNGNCLSDPITLEVDPAVAEAHINIANTITANGDGNNDNWDIKNLQNYPDNEVTIFNRWGNEVYRRKAYANDWNGGNLNAGTYFYQLKIKVCDGSTKTYQGYVMILR